MCLLGQRELIENGKDPTCLSPTETIKAFQSTLSDYRVRPEDHNQVLWIRLRNALLDDYQRTSSKASRSYPRKKKRRRIGVPKILQATEQQINTAKELKKQRKEFRLTA